MDETMTNIKPVKGVKDIRITADLAHEIWNEHFPSVITQAQIDYMVATFQGTHAISQQILKGMRYYLMRLNTEYAGYFAIQPEEDDKKLFLSKLYVKKSFRGQGLAGTALDFVERQCRDMDLHTIRLTVNKKNTGPIAVYEHKGFKITQAIVTDIGHGFVMDDYVMEKRV